LLGKFGTSHSGVYGDICNKRKVSKSSLIQSQTDIREQTRRLQYFASEITKLLPYYRRTFYM
jgi:hypothetical protein